MYSIEVVRKNYLEQLNKEKNHWQKGYEAEQKGESASTISLSQLEAVLSKIENFDEAFEKFVEKEVQSFVKAVEIAYHQRNADIDGFKKGDSRMMAFIPRGSDDAFTELGFTNNDAVVNNFIDHTINVGGFLTQEDKDSFIKSVCNNYGLNYEPERKGRSI